MVVVDQRAGACGHITITDPAHGLQPQAHRVLGHGVLAGISLLHQPEHIRPLVDESDGPSTQRAAYYPVSMPFHPPAVVSRIRRTTKRRSS